MLLEKRRSLDIMDEVGTGVDVEDEEGGVEVGIWETIEGEEEMLCPVDLLVLDKR